MTALQPNHDLEFSVPVDVTQLPSSGRDYDISARSSERGRVAKRLDILEIGSLSARLHIAPAPGGLVQVSGALKAEVTQACVVSLEPVKANITDDFTLTFTRIAPNAGLELDVDPEDEPPEVIQGDVLDLGEVVVEQLALLIDPYPRAPGAVFGVRTIGPELTPKDNVSPFAVLAKLKTKS